MPKYVAAIWTRSLGRLRVTASQIKKTICPPSSTGIGKEIEHGQICAQNAEKQGHFRQALPRKIIRDAGDPQRAVQVLHRQLAGQQISQSEIKIDDRIACIASAPSRRRPPSPFDLSIITLRINAKAAQPRHEPVLFGVDERRARRRTRVRPQGSAATCRSVANLHQIR